MTALSLHTKPAVAAVLLAGCTSTIPVISAMVVCPVNEDDLAAQCAAPTPIPEGATYQDLMRIAEVDRKNLVECENRRQLLQDAINACNAEIRKSNAKIDEINKKYANKF